MSGRLSIKLDYFQYFWSEVFLKMKVVAALVLLCFANSLGSNIIENNVLETRLKRSNYDCETNLQKQIDENSRLSSVLVDSKKSMSDLTHQVNDLNATLTELENQPCKPKAVENCPLQVPQCSSGELIFEIVQFLTRTLYDRKKN